MKGNRRGLRLLLVLLIIAALVYVIKNQRNNTGSYTTPPVTAGLPTEYDNPASDGKLPINGDEVRADARFDKFQTR